MPDSPIEYLPTSRQDERELTIDFVRLIGLIRRNLAKCTILVLIVFTVTCMVCATLIPQTFTSQISFSFPQSSQPSALNLLVGGSGGAGSRYVGVLRSRQFAEKVSKAAHVREACGLDSEEDAIEAIVKGVNVNDSAKDSLVFVSVSLPGPPRIAAGADARRKRVKQAASDAANAYSGVLAKYLSTSDTDREAVLLRAANEQLQTAHADYQAAVRRLGELVTRAPKEVAATAGSAELSFGNENSPGTHLEPGSKASSSPSGASVSSGALQEMQALQMERGRLEADIQSEKAAQSTGRGLLKSQLKSLGSLPQEDPLLASARAAVNAARLNFDTLKVQYGPDHPAVIQARENLDVALNNLRRQTSAIDKGVTTQDVSHQVRLTALTTRLQVVNGLLEKAQKKAFTGLKYTQLFEQRKNDVELRLEVLKATASQAALLSLQSVSLKNRMAVVDRARPPKSGTPGLAVFALISLFIAGLVTALYLVRLGMASSPDGSIPAIVISPESARIEDSVREVSSEGEDLRTVDSGYARGRGPGT